MDGILNIYKEKGYTSHDVVAILRKKLSIKRIGHTGTLDPNAEGVLVVCLGRATKAVTYLEADSKRYIAELTLGVTTDTGDIWGNVLSEKDVVLSEDEIKSAILSFKGKMSQVPPMYSALKVNGKKLYELAREGIEVNRKARDIEIFDIDIIEINNNKVRFEVFCSKGTYIRTLCEDMGAKLGVGGTMSALERIQAGNFKKETTIKLDEINTENLGSYLIDIKEVFKDYPRIELTEKDAFRYLNGIRFEVGYNDGGYAIYIDDKFIGIGRVEEGILRSEKRFNID